MLRGREGGGGGGQKGRSDLEDLVASRSHFEISGGEK